MQLLKEVFMFLGFENSEIIQSFFPIIKLKSWASGFCCDEFLLYEFLSDVAFVDLIEDKMDGR